jgi:cation:H+ antiporter
VRAERLARATRLGQATVGVVFIGAVTSLSGLVTTGTAAVAGDAPLAVSNALGGIAAQTLFLAVADMAWREANLEHAAAAETNLLQAGLLVLMLALPLLASTLPQLALAGFHPVSLLLPFVYVAGLRLLRDAEERPMWRPRRTAATQDAEDGDAGEHLDAALVASFAGLAAVVAVAGWVTAESAMTLSRAMDLDASVVGGVFTAVATSLPELVIAVAAVRRGLLVLAVGDILGGNAFDVLFLAVADGLWAGGSIYAELGRRELFWLALTIVMVAVMLLGLLRRQRHGPGNIGAESAIQLLLYGGGVAALVAA